MRVCAVFTVLFVLTSQRNLFFFRWREIQIRILEFQVIPEVSESVELGAPEERRMKSEERKERKTAPIGDRRRALCI